MILWNAFYEYFLTKGETVRAIVAGLILGLFLLRRFGWIEKYKVYFSRQSAKKYLFLILFLGFALRLAWVIWSPYTPPAAITEDQVVVNHARNLSTGKGYITPTGEPTARRPIAYPLFVAGIFKLFGENFDLIAAINIFLSLITLWLLYRIGVAIGNKLIGLLAAMFLAIYPTSIFASRVLLEEHFFIAMWLGGILLIILDYQKSDWKKIISAAILFGVAAHFRTFSFAMGFIVFFMWFFFKKNSKQAFFRLIVIQLIIYTFALPWAIRNYYKMGEPISYSTAIGECLYFSNNQVSDVRYPIYPTREQGGDIAFLEAKSEMEANRAGKKAAMDWIKDNPWVFVQKALGRGVYMLGLSREGWIVLDNFHSIRNGRVKPSEKLIAKLDRLDNDYYGFIFLLSIFGLASAFLIKKNILTKPGIGFLVITLLYYLAIICVTLGHRKYRFPIEPFFCLFAAYGIAFFTRPLKSSK